MKYIKRNKIILESGDDSIKISKTDSNSLSELKDRFNETKEEINVYNQRKTNLEKVITDNVEGMDISDVVKDIIDGNKFLTMYSPIVKKMARIDRVNGRVEYYGELLKERKDDLTLTGKLSDPDEKKEQVSSLKDKIKEIESKIKEMDGQVKETESEIKEDENELSEHIESIKGKFEEDIKELKISLK